MATVRTSIALQPESLEQLEALRKAWGVTRIAVLRRLLDEAAHKEFGRNAPPGPGPIQYGRPKKNVAKG